MPDISGLAGAEVLAKRRLAVLDDAGGYKVFGEVRPAYVVAVRDLNDRIERVWNTALLQPIGDSARALETSFLLSRNAMSQIAVFGIDVKPQDVNAHAVPGRGQLDAGYQPHVR